MEEGKVAFPALPEHTYLYKERKDVFLCAITQTS